MTSWTTATWMSQDLRERLISVVVIETRKDLPGLAIDPLAPQVRGNNRMQHRIAKLCGYITAIGYVPINIRVWPRYQPMWYLAELSEPLAKDWSRSVLHT
jgi:hypothetical protein